LFRNWEQVRPDERGYPDVGERPATLVRSAWQLFGMSLRILWTCIKEAPEIAVRKRRQATIEHVSTGD